MSTDCSVHSKYRPNEYAWLPTSTAITASWGTNRVIVSNTLAALSPRAKSSSRRRTFSARQMAHRSAMSARWSTVSGSPRALSSARAVTPT